MRQSNPNLMRRSLSIALFCAVITSAAITARGSSTKNVGSLTLTLPGFLNGGITNQSGPSVTLNIGLATQTANTVFAGPASGSAATPTFRAMVPLDIASGAANTYIPYDNAGALGWEAAPSGGASSPLTLTATATTQTPLTLREISGQTADPFDVYSSTSSKLAAVNANGTMVMQGAVQAIRIISTTTYSDTVTLADHVIEIDSNGTETETLPDATTCTGESFIFVNGGGHNITINAVSHQQIGGVASQSLNSGGAKLIIDSDGANWIVIG